jgi:hypothetical protein
MDHKGLLADRTYPMDGFSDQSSNEIEGMMLLSDEVDFVLSITVVLTGAETKEDEGAEWTQEAGTGGAAPCWILTESNRAVIVICTLA